NPGCNAQVLIKIVCAYHSIGKLGGASRDRTDDPLLAKQVLSQLSYGPLVRTLVGLGGLEPPTSPSSGARSNHLSYRPRTGSKRMACRQLVRTPVTLPVPLLKRR